MLVVLIIVSYIFLYIVSKICIDFVDCRDKSRLENAIKRKRQTAKKRSHWLNKF